MINFNYRLFRGLINQYRAGLISRERFIAEWRFIQR
jgi:hypothetical protein